MTLGDNKSMSFLSSIKKSLKKKEEKDEAKNSKADKGKTVKVSSSDTNNNKADISESKITLVSKRWQVGMKFVFNGKTSTCDKCRLIGACQNLEPGKLYEIKSLKDIEHDCLLTEEKVVTAYVIESKTQ